MFGPSVEQKQSEIQAVYNAAAKKIAEQIGNKYDVRKVERLDDREKLMRLADAYTNEKKEKAIKFFCRVLNLIKDSRYIRLAKAIEVIDDFNSYSPEYAEQKFAVQHYNQNAPRKEIKTTYKELKQIRERRKTKKAKLLKKISKVWYFVDTGLIRAVNDIEEICYNGTHNIDADELSEIKRYLDKNERVQEALSEKLPDDLNKLR